MGQGALYGEDARGYVTMSWGHGVKIISRDWILRLVPCFRGDGKIAPNFAKNLTVSSFGKSHFTRF